jgi:hypothetical protein
MRFHTPQAPLLCSAINAHRGRHLSPQGMPARQIRAPKASQIRALAMRRALHRGDASVRRDSLRMGSRDSARQCAGTASLSAGKSATTGVGSQGTGARRPASSSRQISPAPRRVGRAPATSSITQRTAALGATLSACRRPTPRGTASGSTRRASGRRNRPLRGRMPCHTATLMHLEIAGRRLLDARPSRPLLTAVARGWSGNASRRFLAGNGSKRLQHRRQREIARA